jgi:uncharacterized protein YqgC (DUF456 family)
MPYAVGIVLSLGVAPFARRVGSIATERSIPTVLIVIASYYVLFASMSESPRTVLLESMVMTVFLIVAGRVQVEFVDRRWGAGSSAAFYAFRWRCE